MDGIEKMLKSQQLTFGFVGVAPSMLILALVGRWVRGLVNKSDGGSRRKRSEEKRRCWMVIRCGFLPTWISFVSLVPLIYRRMSLHRDLDLLLTPTRARAGPSSPSPRSKRPGPASSPNNDNGSKDDSAAAALTQGHLLLSLSSLRSFAHSSHFPSRDTQLRSAFLDDVRAVEDGATQAATEERRALVRRLERWSDALGWDEGVRS
jgi:nuclear-control-of-ATPase protein 2